MRRTLRLMLSAGLLLALVVPMPAGADEHSPQFRSERVYVHCHGGDEEKVQNLYDAFEWSTAAPTRSVTDGAGCGYLNSGAAGNGPTFAGTFQGNLRSLAVELHIFPSLIHPRTMALGEVDLAVTLMVDDEMVIDDALSGVPAELEDDNFMLTQTVVFGIDGLDALFATEDGVGAETREFSLTFSSTNPEEIIDWVWDTSEVPTGITFNGTATPTLSVE